MSKEFARINFVILILLVLLQSPGCRPQSPKPIAGFSPQTNQRLIDFLKEMQSYQGRKVAVFDGDGTTLGQVPHYLADECLFEYAAKHPDRKPDLIAQMQGLSNVSMAYVQLRVKYLAGLKLQVVRQMGIDCFDRLYAQKIFSPMQELVENLKQSGFEVWIVTASPEALYQGFLSQAYQIPITRIIGVRSLIKDGVITDQILQPVPQDHGKKEAIESFIQARPQLVGGNSRGDKEMIEFASQIRLIINPDTHLGHDQNQSIADYAREQSWLIEYIEDQSEADFPAISSKKYGVRINQAKRPIANTGNSR